jgi:hypothetical protein
VTFPFQCSYDAASDIWNPDQWYEIRGFGTYRYVLVCTSMYWYTIVYMVHTGMYQYVPGLYSFFTSNIAMNWGNILVLITITRLSCTLSIFCHSQNSQNSILRMLLVTKVHTSMYLDILCTY